MKNKGQVARTNRVARRTLWLRAALWHLEHFFPVLQLLTPIYSVDPYIQNVYVIPSFLTVPPLSLLEESLENSLIDCIKKSGDCWYEAVFALWADFDGEPLNITEVLVEVSEPAPPQPTRTFRNLFSQRKESVGPSVPDFCSTRVTHTAHRGQWENVNMNKYQSWYISP